MSALPRLHITTDDDVLGASGFVDRATTLLETHGPAIALHLRGPRTPTRTLFGLAAALAPVARSAGALFLVNDRADVALAVDADGVQLGQRSLAAADARALGPGWTIGVSVHDVVEAGAAIDAKGTRGSGSAGGPDFLLVGSVWETASHPGRPGAGTGLVRDVQALEGPPVIAIGGVTPDRVQAARAAGATGVAVLSGVWDHEPAAAAGEYLAALGDDDGARPRGSEDRGNGRTAAPERNGEDGG